MYEGNQSSSQLSTSEASCIQSIHLNLAVSSGSGREGNACINIIRIGVSKIASSYCISAAFCNCSCQVTCQYWCIINRRDIHSQRICTDTEISAITHFESNRSIGCTVFIEIWYET